MRVILIDWLIEVHDKFDLMNETLYITVNLIDRFLSKQAVVGKKFQLVGLVALLLACKYKELEILASFLMELALVDYEMLRQWNNTCEFHSHYSDTQFLECRRKMMSLHKKATSDKLTGVHRKYSSSKFGYIAINTMKLLTFFLLCPQILTYYSKFIKYLL
ncbi:unnamed protein product [Cochlearia groenlandica]